MKKKRKTLQRTSNIMTYRKSGVDVAGADAWLSHLAPLVRSTHRKSVVSGSKQFTGLFALNGSASKKGSILVASADGVGTKLKLASNPRHHQSLGIDVVAMNVNDVITCGAKPLFFLDYLAVGELQPKMMTHLIRGIVDGCKQSDCVLLGGETAEMPAFYKKGEYDVAGFCVGIVERKQLIDGSKVRVGDAIVGLASSGVHANGFSMVRKVFSKRQLTQHKRDLLVPTRIYVKPVLRAIETVSIHAIAHITGGGLARRIPSLLTGRQGLRTRLIKNSWPIPSLFKSIQREGMIKTEEMFSTFNMGIGMAMVCPVTRVKRLKRLLKSLKVPAWTIGIIERA